MPITSFTNEGLTFDVTDSGPADGVPIVLLQGFPQRASSWNLVTPLLNQRGYRTIAPDQRGYSPGARPKGRKQYAMPHLAADVAALIDEIGSPVHLVGHDWGAGVAWAVAANYPDKIKTLTAVSVGHPGAFVRSMVRSNQVLRSWYMLAFQFPKLPERVMSSGNAQSTAAMARFGMTPVMVEQFHNNIVEDGALTGGLNWYRGLPFTPPSYVGRVSAPTTVVWSDDDAALSMRQAVDSDRFVDGPFSFVHVDGASHWIPEERPGELAEAILARIASVD